MITSRETEFLAGFPHFPTKGWKALPFASMQAGQFGASGSVIFPSFLQFIKESLERVYNDFQALKTSNQPLVAGMM